MRRFLSIRVKLALVFLLLLAIPVMGLWYAARLKNYLMTAQEQALALTARAVATILNDHPELFRSTMLKSSDGGKEIHAYLLQHRINLDGYYGDWSEVAGKLKTYDSGMVLESTGVHQDTSLRFKHVIGRDENYYYALFIVEDDIVVHREPDKARLDKSDHLQIALEDDYGRLNRYLLSAGANGWVNGHLMPADQYNFMPVRYEPDIEGYWRDTVGGYVLEIRLPIAMVKHNRISFAIADVDDSDTREVATAIGTSGTRQSSDLGFLLTRSPELESILQALDKPEARISVIDSKKRLRASVGSFYGEPDIFKKQAEKSTVSLKTFLGPLVRLFAESYAEVFSADLQYMQEFDLEMIREPLKGRAITTRRSLANSNAEVLIAAEPLRAGNEVMGAVIVEQPTNSILAAKNRIIEDTIKITFVVFLAGGLVLFLFASRLSRRIRRLTAETENAIGGDGVVRSVFRPSADRDELGDLSRRFAGMLLKLREYSLYQEKMADNLEHEIRTPVAGISAALANIAKELEGKDGALHKYLGSIQENIKRIETIMTGIREATTLDDALQQAEQTVFDLGEALQAWVRHGYDLTFPDKTFRLQVCGHGIPVRGDAGRIRQMLDKIVENAVDIGFGQSEVAISLAVEDNIVLIRVENEGPLLPEHMHEQIFQSMVSLRHRKGRGSHLGLGLYIARKIVEFHGGGISAANRTDGKSGAVFTITVPLAVMK